MSQHQKFIILDMIKISDLYTDMEQDSVGLKCNQMRNNMLFLPFLTTSNSWLVQYRAHLNTKRILINDVDVVILCSLLAKCLKLSQMQKKKTYFISFLQV